MSTERLDPDALLQAIQRQEARQQRGRLKIFLGMAAGVGKTYAMLSAAQRIQLEEAVDLVVGYVESHGRIETDKLLQGLEIIPRRQIQYRGTLIEEMDLDRVLERHPALVLVDELAHSNAPESRHTKRYQDVMELLEAGIDVYTTVNVQHIESRSDTIGQITGIQIQERVPDTFLDLADDLTLIDITPDELLDRLAEGKVYLGERAQRAVEHFFQKGNLTALREIALRLTAEHVDQDLQDYLSQHRISKPWRSHERLLVAVGPSPMSAELIRWTRRMASMLNASWLAVYVDHKRVLFGDSQQQLSRNLDLARELGAEVILTQGEHLLNTLLHVAHQQHVTQLILGKPQQSWWRDLINGSFLTFHTLLHAPSEVDIWMVNSSQTRDQLRFKKQARPWKILNSQAPIKEYLISMTVMALITGLGMSLVSWMGYWSVALLYLMGVMGLAFKLSRGPVLLAAGLSAMLWNFFFIPPLYTFAIKNVHDYLMCIIYFLSASLMVGLTSRVREQEANGRLREQRLALLYRYSRKLAETATTDEMLFAAQSEIQSELQTNILILPVKSENRISQSHLDAKEWPVAYWAFEHRRPAGRFTDTLPGATGYYVPLITQDGIYGVMGIYAEQLSFEQRQLLETLAQQLALAMERKLLQEATTRMQVHQMSESLYNALFNSVSHELRTPITTIQGAVQNLHESSVQQNPELLATMLEDLTLASRRMDHLVANLLDMSRLQSGKISLNLGWCDLGDILRASVKALTRELQHYPLQIHLSEDLPLIYADFGLLEQAITNIIHNAMSHNQPGTAIEIEALKQKQNFILRICDKGKGIPPESLPHLFEKFYRAPGARSGGTGLGLSIAKGFIEAHQGHIKVSNAADGGACFLIELPLREVPSLPDEEELDFDDTDFGH